MAPAAEAVADAAPPTNEAEAAKRSSRFGALKPFVIVSSSYLLFTITDGAIRTIVLLRAYQLGFTAMDVAIMCANSHHVCAVKHIYIYAKHRSTASCVHKCRDHVLHIWTYELPPGFHVPTT